LRAVGGAISAILVAAVLVILLAGAAFAASKKCNIHGSLDGERDHFYCRPGRDQAVAGHEDPVSSDCETLK
jgi:hypothetical protein